MQKFQKRVFFVVLIALALVGCGWQAAQAAPAYPGSRAIEVTVPWSAGGSTDMVCRVAANLLSAKIGVPVNVVNEPGGQGIPGTVSALLSAPDGYSLLGDADGSNAIPEAWGEDVPFKAAERTYICRIASFPWVFAVASDTGWKSMDDIAEAIKNNPTAVKFGWLGGTAGADCAPAQFIAALRAKGIDTSKVNMVTFAGGADLAVAIAGGHVDFGCASTTSVASTYEAGKLGVVGITSAERFPAYPNVPTTKEQGWDTVNFMGHVGFAGATGIPDEVVKILADAMGEVMSTDEAAQKFSEISAIADFLGPQDFRDYVLNLAEQLVAIKIN